MIVYLSEKTGESGERDHDLGKLVFAVLALGPLVTPGVFNIAIVAAGLIVTVSMFVVAYFVDVGG
jgi:hypothetical protein